MKNLNDTKGSTLIETIVALTIAAIGLTTLLTLCGVLLQARHSSDTLYQQGRQLNTLYADISRNVKNNGDKSPEAIDSIVRSVTQNYPGWQCTVTPEGMNLYTLDLTMTDAFGKESHFCSKIYSGSP